MLNGAATVTGLGLFRFREAPVLFVQKQRCAIKVFRGEVKDKVWVQRRFEQEVAALQKVRHPNVVRIYAHGVAPSGARCLVMEFVEGKSLREVLEVGALSPRRTARLLDQLAGALDAIHELGICHRDVKPENIMIRHEGAREEESVLIDFSIAIVKDANETVHGLSRAAGSFDYMAPEQAVGYAEPSSDIYSLAKLLLEMVTGRQLRKLYPTPRWTSPTAFENSQEPWRFAFLVSQLTWTLLACGPTDN
jgi:serine/threonine protein kinase